MSTATETPEQAVTRAWKTYRRAMGAGWPESVRNYIAGVVTDLLEALELYGALDDDSIHPASEWQELARDPEAKATALRKAAVAVAEHEAELVRVCPACAEDRAG